MQKLEPQALGVAAAASDDACSTRHVRTCRIKRCAPCAATQPLLPAAAAGGSPGRASMHSCYASPAASDMALPLLAFPPVCRSRMRPLHE